MVNCVDKWLERKEQSFKECFSECYEYLYLGLSPFYIVNTKHGGELFWKDIFESKKIETWSDMAKRSGLNGKREVNKALLFSDAYSEYGKFFELLNKCVNDNNIYYPLADDLDPFTMASMINYLFDVGFNDICLSALGEVENIIIDGKMSAEDIRPVNELYNPMHLYTKNEELLCTTYHDYECYILASDSKSLLSGVVDNCNLEGFYIEGNEGLDW